MPSNFPEEYDVFPIPGTTSKINAGYTHAELHRDLGLAIEAIEACLGINPQGSSTTVSERFTTIVAGSGGGGGTDLEFYSETATDAIIATPAGDFNVTAGDDITITAEDNINFFTNDGFIALTTSGLNDIFLVSDDDVEISTSNAAGAVKLISAGDITFDSVNIIGNISTNIELFVTGVFEVNSNAVKTQADAANISATNTGTSTTKFVTPDGLAGSVFGSEIVGVEVFAGGAPLNTGDGKIYFRCPTKLNGMNIVSCAIANFAKSTSGNVTVQLARGRQAAAGTAHAFVDILSTALTIDANEFDSKDATTAAVINTSNDDIATGDLIRIDVDVAGTGATGLWVTITFQLP